MPSAILVRSVSSAGAAGDRSLIGPALVTIPMATEDDHTGRHLTQRPAHAVEHRGSHQLDGCLVQAHSRTLASGKDGTQKRHGLRIGAVEGSFDRRDSVTHRDAEVARRTQPWMVQGHALGDTCNLFERYRLGRLAPGGDHHPVDTFGDVRRGGGAEPGCQ